MAKTLIGPNTALRYLKNYRGHVDYWHEVNPAVLLAYVDKKEHCGYIQEYAAAFPESMVVARIQHPLDGGFHLKPTGPNDDRRYVASPEDYLKDYGFLGRTSNIILNVFNEPAGDADSPTIDRLVSWFLEYIPLAVNGKVKSLLFNWGDRQPRIFGGMMDARFGGILKLAALYPELFYMGFHLYGPDDITEHLESYVKLCQELEIKPLRVIASEFGFDKTNGKESGYKSRGVGGGAYAAWQISQVQHDLAPYIKSGVLVGLNVFQEGNSGGWEAFDIENDQAYKDEIKRAAQAGELSMITTPVSVKDVERGELYRLSTPGKIITAYVAPRKSDKSLGTIPDNAVVEVGNKVTVDRESWLQVKYPTFSGWGWIESDLISMRSTMTVPVVKVDDTPTQPLPQPPPSVPVTPAPTSIPDKPEPTPESPQTGFKTVLTPIQISKLMAWRAELKATVETYTDRIALIDSMLLSVNV